MVSGTTMLMRELVAAWYTNPQTEAFCGMLGVQNKINPPVNR